MFLGLLAGGFRTALVGRLGAEEAGGKGDRWLACPLGMGADCPGRSAFQAVRVCVTVTEVFSEFLVCGSRE